MSAIIVRDLSDETLRALRRRAKRNGRSADAELRAILDAVVPPPPSLRLGSALAELARPLGGLELKVQRDKTPAQPADVA